MSTAGVKELKNRLTHYLRRAKQGEEIVVTERGRPIALIHAIHTAGQAVSLEGRLARLAAQGRLTLPTRKARTRAPKVKISGPPLSKTILEDRR
jgi:antitoxin (DNA-binding transcriptional repressor) of toxin-antitoxin stability system